MAKNDNLGDFLTDIANAIREKKGTSGPINAQDFSSEIASIETGGGDTPTPDIPVIGDGKTYLYIKIAAPGRMEVPLYFSQTVANGVAIDWGDGSATQTLSGTGNKNTTHTYANIGEYVISLNPSNGCTLGLGRNSSSYCVMGATGNYGQVYCNMLQHVEIGKSVTSIDNYAFQHCYSLASIVIPDSVTSIGDYTFQYCTYISSIVIPSSVTTIGSYAFYRCSSLASVEIPDSVTTIGNYAFCFCSSLSSVVISQGVPSIGDYTFQYCYSLASVVIPSGVTSIGRSAFQNCYGMAYYDFRAFKSVPTLSNIDAFGSKAADCKIVVPDSLYSSWTTATNWKTHILSIVKASEFNA